MKNIQKIAILGGTGKSGKYLVKQLIQQGFHFKALIRNRERITIPNHCFEIVDGSVKNYETVRTLVDGCDAIISTLGMGIPPSEPNLFSQATSNILRAMNECNIRRYIVITGLNVDAPSDRKGAKTKFATEWMYTNYPKSTTDKQVEYDILSKSNIDWTMVRLPMIEETDARSEMAVSLDDCPGDKISATDLAHFLIAQFTDDTYCQKAPFIANV
jgi:putative NADH-flavin reductase